MQHYDIVLFDLDGTLTDPGLGITNAVAHALRRFNIPVPPRPELYKFIGPPLVDSFMEYYGMTKEQADTAVIYYREHYRDTGLFENVVYDGIDAMLTHLTAAGKMPVWPPPSQRSLPAGFWSILTSTGTSPSWPGLLWTAASPPRVT